MGDELLDHFAEGFEDAVVVDRGQVEGDGRVVEAVVRELVLDALDDVALEVELVVVAQAVDFVDEHLDVDGGVGLGEVHDRDVQPGDGLEVVVLRVDDPDQCADLAEDGVGVEGGVHKFELPWEVPDLKVHEGARDC